MAARDLHCPNGCPEGRFEALGAVVVVDRRSHLVDVATGASTFVCATCRSVAVDLAAVPVEMAGELEVTRQHLVCPACRLEMLPPEEDPLAPVLQCPGCRAHFTPEEGMPHLFGTEPADDDGG